MNTLNKNLLMGGVAACAVAFASCGDKKDSAGVETQVDEAVANVKEPAKEVADDAKAVVSEAATETVSISLSGLKWASACGRKVRSALSAIDGVEVKDVSKTTAEVSVDRSKVDKDQLTKAVSDAGFSATID